MVRLMKLWTTSLVSTQEHDDSSEVKSNSEYFESFKMY